MIAILYNNKWMLNTDESNIHLYENNYTISNITYDSELGFISPTLLNGIYVEGATQQEIETYNDQLYPNEISRRQLKLQWQLDGRELSEIDDTINSMPETTEQQRISKITAKNAWQESIVFERKDILIQNLGLSLFNNIQELNNFFNRANNL